MAERNLCCSCNSGVKVFALKEALCTQQQLLQKLYAELEEEREASATAASEALSMILRLQGEKAAEKMEAVHYRRMTEEKIQHAEESLMIFRELLFEKEMEITSLVSQVEWYRSKQLGIGEALVGELSVQGMVGRTRSTPIDVVNGLTSKVVLVDEKKGMAELHPKKSDEVLDREIVVPNADTRSFFDKFAVGDLCSYRDQIKQLDEQLKELSHCSSKQAIDATKSEQQIGRIILESSLIDEADSLCSNCTTEDSTNLREVDEINIPCIKAKEIENSTTENGLCDIFEVPDNHENDEICQLQRNGSKEDENRLQKPESIPQGPRSCCLNNQSELVKNSSQHAHQVKNEGIIGGLKALGNPKARSAASRVQFQKLHKRLAKLECERRRLKPEISVKVDEELTLLREIKQKLDVIESEMRSSQANSVESDIRSLSIENFHEPEENSLVSIMETTPTTNIMRNWFQKVVYSAKL